MFCTKCGLKIPDNIKFCPKCGNRVLGNGMAGENLHNTAKAAGEQRQPVRQRQREETRHKRSKASKGKKKATLGLLCAVCCVAGLMLIIRNESKIDALFKEEEPKQEENVEAGDNTSVLHQYDESYNAKNMVDMAGVLSVSEEKELSEYMEKIKNVQKYELAAVIIPHDELGGKTAEEYSETYYLQNDIGVGSDKSGVLFLAALDDEGHGDAYVYTYGKAVSEITNEYLDNFFWDEMVSRMKKREYKAAVNYFADQCSGLLGINMESD